MRGMMRLALLGVPGASGASAFSPDDYGGLGLWIDASHAASLFQDSAGTTPAAADGDPVGRAGRVATNLATQATTANKPVLKLNIQNGLPVLRFNGTPSRLMLANLSLITNITSVSTFAVYSHTAIASSTGFVLSWHTATTGSRLGLSARAEGFGIGGRRLDTDGFTNVVGGTATTDIVIHSGSIDYAAAKAKSYVNGALVAEDNAFQTPGATSNTVSAEATVGTHAAAQITGDVCEMLVYVPALTDEQRATVETYLSDKWGITLS